MKRFTRKHINKTLFALLLAFAILLVACESRPELPEHFGEPFRATVEGKVDGKEIKAEVFCDPTEHLTKEIYNVMTVTFSAPATLEGITVSLRSDGKATVRLKNAEEDMPLYNKLVEPYLALMPSSEYASLEKTADGYKIACEQNGGRFFYYFDVEGQPKSIEGKIFEREIRLNITKIIKINK